MSKVCFASSCIAKHLLNKSNWCPTASSDLFKDALVRDKDKRKKSLAPGGVRIHDFLIMSVCAVPLRYNFYLSSAHWGSDISLGAPLMQSLFRIVVTKHQLCSVSCGVLSLNGNASLTSQLLLIRFCPTRWLPWPTLSTKAWPSSSPATPKTWRWCSPETSASKAASNGSSTSRTGRDQIARGSFAASPNGRISSSGLRLRPSWFLASILSSAILVSRSPKISS